MNTRDRAAGNASASTKAINWLNPFAWIRAAIQKHPFVTAAVIFVGAALVQAFLQEQYSINYACMQLTDADVSIVYPHWLARDGSQQQAPIVLQLATCAEEPAFSAAANAPSSTGSSRQRIATLIPLRITGPQQSASPLAQRMPAQTPTQPAPAQPVSLVVHSGLDVAVVQGLDLAQSSPFTVTLDASSPEQTLIVSYLPGLPEVGNQRSVTINGQELPIELEQSWRQRARLLLSTLFGPAGVALAAIGFFLAVLHEDRKQRELREIEELARAAEKCSNGRLSTPELLKALDHLTQLTQDNVDPVARTFANYLVTAFCADPWHVFEHSTQWKRDLQHLSSLVSSTAPSSVENILSLLAWYNGDPPPDDILDKVSQWDNKYLVGFAWNWQWRKLMNCAALINQWKELRNNQDFVLGVLISQAVLEKAERAEKLKQSFLNDVQYVVSKSTKTEPDDQQENTTKERLAKLGQNIDYNLDEELNSWIKEEVAQGQTSKPPESVAKEMAKVVASLVYARKVGHQRKKSTGPLARMLWPLDDDTRKSDPNYSCDPAAISSLPNRVLNSPLVIFQQPKSSKTEIEDGDRKSTKVRISLQYQLYSKFDQKKEDRVLPVFAYLPATLVETENTELTTLLWLCRCVANEVVSYLCEEPHNRFTKLFSAEEQERVARLLAAVGYHVAAGEQCLFQPVPDAEMLDVDAYYGSLLQTDSYSKLCALMQAARLRLAWREHPAPTGTLAWTETLLSIAGFKKAIILIDNLEQPLALGLVTAAEYAQVLVPLLDQAPLLTKHRMDLMMFLPATIQSDLEQRGICFLEDTDLTNEIAINLGSGGLKAASFNPVL